MSRNYILLLAVLVALPVPAPAAEELPRDVSEVCEAVHGYALAALAGDLDAFADFLVERKRPRAQSALDKLRRGKAALKVLKQPPLVVLVSESEATFCSQAWRLGILGIKSGDANQQLTTKVSLRRLASSATETEGTGARWLVATASPDKLGTVPGLHAYWRNKHPDGTVYVSPDAPRWLAPPDWNIIDAIRAIDERLQAVWAENREVTEAVRAVCGGIQVFADHFPASKEGRQALTQYWRERRQKKRDPLPPGEEIALTRRGLCGPDPARGDSQRSMHLKAIGTSYLWGKKPQRRDAIELAVHASYHPQLAGDAVYYGLSVLRPAVPEHVLERLVELALQHVNVGRILWGTKGRHLDMIPYLRPYLVHNDPRVADRAATLELALRGELKYEDWMLEQTADRQRELLGEDAKRLRDLLLADDSGVRRELLRVIRRHGLFRAFDRSFRDAFEACTQDGDPEVRKLGASFLEALQGEDENRSSQALQRLLRLAKDDEAEVRRVAATQLGSHFVWHSGRQEPQAIETLLALSRDPHRSVRYQAVYFGLSVVREKSAAVVDRLIEIALEDRERNMRGRITWGLRGCPAAHKRLRERADAGDKDAADLLAEVQQRQ